MLDIHYEGQFYFEPIGKYVRYTRTDDFLTTDIWMRNSTNLKLIDLFEKLGWFLYSEGLTQYVFKRKEVSE